LRIFFEKRKYYAGKSERVIESREGGKNGEVG